MIGNLASWSLTYLMHSTLLIGSVWLVHRWIRSAAVRDVLWKVAITGALVTATLQLAISSQGLAEKRVWNAPAPIVSATPAPQSDAMPAASAKADPLPAASSRAAAWPSISLSAIVMTVWGLVVAALLARLFLSRARLVHLLTNRRELVLGEARTLVDSLAGPDRTIRLTVSPSVPSPLAMLGWEIVVPEFFFDRLSSEGQRTILAHEVAHLVRRDPLWLMIIETIKAIFFFQPLNAVAAAKTRELAEFLCDDAAVRHTGDRRALAETLAELASSMRPMPARVAAMAEGNSNLIARVRRVLQSETIELPLRMRVRFALAMIPLGLIAVFAPGVAPARIVSSVASALQQKAAPEHEMDNHFVEGVLDHSYQGPEGKTQVVMLAKNAWISQDGESFRFDDANGYVRATYKAARGVTRVAEVLPGPALTPKYSYRVDGVSKDWCDDARRLLVAAVLHKEIDDIPAAGASATSTRKLSKWTATVEETGTRDGIPVTLHVFADSVFYDDVTGVIDSRRSGAVDLEETLGGKTRRFHFEAGKGSTEGMDGLTRDEQRRWVGALLSKYTSSDRSLVHYLQSQLP